VAIKAPRTIMEKQRGKCESAPINMQGILGLSSMVFIDIINKNQQTGEINATS
jgi:hypothetical protein